MIDQLSPKHKIFADEYILNSDAIVSYQKAYPKAKAESARVESYKILQNPTIAKYIQEGKDKIKNARENNLIETLKAKDNSNILTREKIVEMQSNVVKITYNQFIKSKDKQDADAFNKSVVVFNKLEGLDAPTKTKTEIEISKEKFEGFSFLPSKNKDL
jgi:phage terminase small subunit